MMKIKNFLNALVPPETAEFDHALAIVSLLCAVCIADEKEDKQEEQVVVNILTKLLNIDKEQATELLAIGMEKANASISVFDFTSQLSDLDADARTQLIKAMWEVAYADGYLDPMEEALIRKVAALIHVSHSDFIRTKLSMMHE